jgi:predicted permease
MNMAVTGPKYRGQPKAVLQFWDEVERRVSHLPGVKSEGLVNVLPLNGSVGWGGINVEGYNPPPGQELQVDIRSASADYFRTMNVPLIEGRFFNSHDATDSQQVMIIDAKFARRFWPHESAVGKHLWFDPKTKFTICGVVGVVKQYGLDTDGKIATYFAHSQQPNGGMYLAVHTSTEAESLASAIVREVHSVDGSVPVIDIRTMQDLLQQSLARQRFTTVMLGAFALFAMLLAAVGVYGVMSYLVSQSTHDIGVRVALGAQTGSIVGLVVRQGMQLAGLGIVLGLAGAIGLTRLMSSLLFGVSPRDLATFGGVAFLLAAVALLAVIIPASRATRVDPLVALREE